MGKRGPTATPTRVARLAEPYSRWGNAGQPQLIHPEVTDISLIADGETRANRNRCTAWCRRPLLIADGETRANRNFGRIGDGRASLIADGETRANRNSADQRTLVIGLIADGETRANRNDIRPRTAAGTL